MGSIVLLTILHIVYDTAGIPDGEESIAQMRIVPASPSSLSRPSGSLLSLFQHLLPAHSRSREPSSIRRLGRSAGFLGHGVEVGLVEVLDLALLAALLDCGICVSGFDLSDLATSRLHFRLQSIGRLGVAYLPPGETKVHLAATFGGDPGVVLQAPAHGAGGDGQVAVVAASGEAG